MNRILYFGMTGAFSQPPLMALLAAGFDIGAVIVPDEGQTAVPIRPLLPPPPSDLPLLSPYLSPNIIHIAWERGIPVYALHQPDHPDVLAELGRWAADVACVACFNKIFPANLLALLPNGFLNVHPSLLPAYRGLDPIFWQLRQGETNMGVTVHRLAERLDRGAIVAQQSVRLADGLSRLEIDGQMATVGGELLVVVLGAEKNGRSQNEDLATYQPMPQAGDFALSTSWSAQRAFNFMRGTSEWQRPYAMTVAGERLGIKTAVAFDTTAVLNVPLKQEQDKIKIQFSPGVLTATRH